jgi:hypothetical protein
MNNLTKNRALGAGLALALVISLVLLPESPLYGQTTSYPDPGGHPEEEGELEPAPTSSRILIERRVSSPFGEDFLFGVSTYETPSGDTCYDTVVAESEVVIGTGGGGFCTNAPMKRNEHLRASIGSQMLMIQPPETDDTEFPPLPYWTTDVSGTVSETVRELVMYWTLPSDPGTLREVTSIVSRVVPENGAFIAVVPGFVEAPEVVVEALDFRGRTVQKVVLGHCADPNDCP